MAGGIYWHFKSAYMPVRMSTQMSEHMSVSVDANICRHKCQHLNRYKCRICQHLYQYKCHIYIPAQNARIFYFNLYLL